MPNIRQKPITLSFSDGSSKAARDARLALLKNMSEDLAEEESKLADIGMEKDSPYKRWVGKNEAGAAVITAVTFIENGHCGLYDVMLDPVKGTKEHIGQLIQYVMIHCHKKQLATMLTALAPTADREKRLSMIGFHRVGAFETYEQETPLTP